MSYNLYWWNAFQAHPSKGRRVVDKMNEYIERNNDAVDLIGCQECEPNSLNRKGLKGGFRVAVETAGHGIMYRSSVLSKKKSGTFKLNEQDQWGERRVGWAKFQHKASGEEFIHFNTHWCVCDETSLFRTSQTVADNIKRISQEEGNLPFVLTGDFNVFSGCQNSKAIRFLTGNTVDGKAPTVHLQNMHPDNGGTHGHENGCKIDWMLTQGLSRRTSGRDFELKEHTGSDHGMIWASLSFGGSLPAPSPPSPSPPSPGPDTSCASGFTDVKTTCGGCKVLANNMSAKYRTCNAYCRDQGRSCVGAWEERANDCDVLDTMDCNFDFHFTSDAICECSASGALPAPTPSGGACNTGGWSDVKKSCGTCKVLANNMSARHRTCNAYCQAQGTTCVGAWEERANDCNVLETKDCGFDFHFTSDAICECRQ